MEWRDDKRKKETEAERRKEGKIEKQTEEMDRKEEGGSFDIEDVTKLHFDHPLFQFFPNNARINIKQFLVP